MKKDAKEKRQKHARLIARCEKKFPVYGFGDINNTVKRLKKMKVINEDGEHDKLVERRGSIPNFDDINYNFDKDKITDEVAEELRKFIAKKTEN